MLTARIKFLLRSPTSNLIRTPNRIPSGGQLPIRTGKGCRRRHTTPTSKRPRNNATLPLRRAQRKAITSSGSSNSAAGPRCIPSPRSNDTSFLRAIHIDVKETAATEGCTGRAGLCGCWPTAGRGGRGCGTSAAAAVLGKVLNACGGAGGFHAIWIGGDEFAGLNGPADIVVVPDFVEDAGFTA